MLQTPGGGGRRSSAGQSLAAGLARQRELELSEQDTLNVIDLVAAEYGVNPHRIYLAGHSMGSGGAWHLAATYPDPWAAVASLSGPFVDERTYPVERLRGLPIFMADGTGSTGTLAASRGLQRYLEEAGGRRHGRRSGSLPRGDGVARPAQDVRRLRRARGPLARARARAIAAVYHW